MICMCSLCTKFGGRVFFGLRDFSFCFKIAKFSFQTMDYIVHGSKNRVSQKSLCKWRLIKYSCTPSLVSMAFFLQNCQIFLSKHGPKKQNQLKKFMQVEVDVKCICTKFCGHGMASPASEISLLSLKFGHIFLFKLPSFHFRPWHF